MVRCKGPVASIAASGSIGRALIFSENKGRRYLKKLTKPKQPRTDAQLAQRAISKWISSRWSTLSASVMAAWAAYGETVHLPAYQAFLKLNLTRWATYKAPSLAYPPTEAAPVAVFPSLTPTARLRTVLLVPTAVMWALNAGVLLHRSTTPGFTPSRSNAIACTTATLLQRVDYVDGPLQSGTYYYAGSTFTLDGKWGPVTAPFPAVIP